MRRRRSRTRRWRSVPVHVRGGIGLRTAAACRAGGAAGVVLDDQLALARECGALPQGLK